jgi:UDP-N-acetylmuramoyl-L-alanyl-D-glutamate--2,6-diaminopimelate ligase
MFGTIDYQLGMQTRPASHTTPESHDVFRLIGQAQEKPRAVIMEVSSHALALDRIGGMAYDVGLLTNVTLDHLDFHKSMEAYYQAKKRLFTDYLKTTGAGVVNIDDAWGRRLAQELKGKKLITYGTSADAAVRIVNHECTWDGSAVELSTADGRVEFRSALRGFFNVYNMTTLYAGSLALNYDRASVERAFAATATVPGRMDRVPLKADFAVIVDYAHTPDALINILQTARPLTKGKLICVFGCGGDRDRTKRPIMGSAVASFADEAIVTSDNPRSEKPISIIEEIIKGIPLDFPHIIVPDRRSAIKKALSMAHKGDCVVIAGKGHEDYQEIQGKREPFNDRDVVIESYHE